MQTYCFFSRSRWCRRRPFVTRKTFDLCSKHRGGSRIFFRTGCTRLLLYFNSNKQHSFFWQNTSCIRKPQVILGGGGAHPLHPPPRSAPETRLLKPGFHVWSLRSPRSLRSLRKKKSSAIITIIWKRGLTVWVFFWYQLLLFFSEIP